jgi:hypothetical protein
MATHEFYATDNHHNERQIRILSVGSLVSKPPTKEKRISIKVSMPLSGSINMGAPEWLDRAYIFVAQNHDTVTPEIEFKGYSIDFSAENLFGENVSSPNCTMRGFEITECGNEETPDVVLNFTLRVSFSGRIWNWLGQFVGEEVWARFTPGASEDSEDGEEDGTLLDDGENDEAALDVDPDNEHDGPTLVKSGPKSLANYHEEEVAKEKKRGRGRPKKSVVADAF